MKYLPLIWAMLWRSRARTWMTFASIAVAFLLFGLLRAVQTGFDAGVKLARDDLLITTAKGGFTRAMPLAYLSDLKAIEGIANVRGEIWLGGYYQDPKQRVAIFAATDPADLVANMPEMVVDPDQVRTFSQSRIGMLVGDQMAKDFGWKPGDRVQVNSDMPRKDGSKVWEFEVAGVARWDEALFGRHIPLDQAWVHYDYYTEAAQWPSFVGVYVIRVQDVQNVTAVANAVDARFRNAAVPTETQRHADFVAGMTRQIGDVGLILRSILAAVFFTLLLVTANTMMQAFRERIPELAALKTMGFTNRKLALLTVGEALLLCLPAAALGLALAGGMVPPLRGMMAQMLGAMTIENMALVAGFGLAVAAALVAALVPAWKAARLSVVEALMEGR